MPPPRSTWIATLGDLKEYDHRLYGFCACGRQGYLDLDALIARFGPDRSYLKGSFVLRCTACGGVAESHLHPPQPYQTR
ncbi:hypothetical protein [Amorphus sp. 3PC139-8]|uniref:hypothetical protein n=1 Tax=Amorphus sp. 3PC139-8 TaxID=2735676 RepID=UPI00345D47EF